MGPSELHPTNPIKSDETLDDGCASRLRSPSCSEAVGDGGSILKKPWAESVGIESSGYGRIFATRLNPAGSTNLADADGSS